MKNVKLLIHNINFTFHQKLEIFEMVDVRHDIHFPCIMAPVCELLPNGPCLIPLDHNCINTLCSNPQRFNNGGTLDYPYILTDFSGNVYTSFSC